MKSQTHYLVLRIFLLALLLIITASACQGIQSRDEHSPYYQPGPGSLLILNTAVEIPPNQASIYLQYGKVVREKDIQVREANCKFEVRDVLPVAQTIQNDTFVIQRVQLQNQFVAYDRVIVASAMEAQFGSPVAEVYTTTYYLKSEKQPQVLYLTCQHWEVVGDGNHLSIEEIRQALGVMMTLDVKAAKTQ